MNSQVSAEIPGGDNKILYLKSHLSTWPGLVRVWPCLRSGGSVGVRLSLYCLEGVPGLHHGLPRQLCGHLDIVARPRLQSVKPGAVFG